MQVYVHPDVDHKSFYLESNLQPQGSANPAKALLDDKEADAGLHRVAYILVDPNNNAADADANYDLSGLTFVVEDSFFHTKTATVWDFDGATVKVIGSDDRARPSEELPDPDSTSDHPDFSRRIVEYDSNLYGRAGVAGTLDAFQRMQGNRFDASKAKLAVFVSNYDTQAAARAFIPKGNRLALTSLNLAGLHSALAARDVSKSRIFLLGHMEGTALIVKDPMGNILSSLDITALPPIEKEFNVDIIPISCESARVSNTGVVTQFNTVEAIHRFANALRAENNLQFWQSWSAGMPLVLGDTILRSDGKQIIHIDIYDQEGHLKWRVHFPVYASATSFYIFMILGLALIAGLVIILVIARSRDV